jgi:hypothetical protein
VREFSLPGHVLSVLERMSVGDKPRDPPPIGGSAIGHDGGAWIVEQRTGEVLAHRGDTATFVNSTRQAFEATRLESERRLEAVAQGDQGDETLATEMEGLVTAIDPATADTGRESWWHAAIDGVLRC